MILLRLGIILTVLLGSVLTSLLVPAIVSAQGLTPPPALDPMQPVLQLIGLLLEAVLMGGVVAYILDDIPFWKNWTPRSKLEEALKSWAVTLINVCLGGVLIYAQTTFVPWLFPQLPPSLQLVISWGAQYLSSNINHQRDVLFGYRQQSEKQFAYARFNPPTPEPITSLQTTAHRAAYDALASALEHKDK